MYYYKIEEQIGCSLDSSLPYEKVEAPGEVMPLVYLFDREPGSCRASFRVNDASMLFADKEDVSWLSSGKLAEAARGEQADDFITSVIRAGKLRAVNLRHPKFTEILKEKQAGGKKRVHVLAIGDVGSTLLTGLHLLGGDVISSIGICDISDKVTARSRTRRPTSEPS